MEKDELKKMEVERKKLYKSAEEAIRNIEHYSQEFDKKYRKIISVL